MRLYRQSWLDRLLNGERCPICHRHYRYAWYNYPLVFLVPLREAFAAAECEERHAKLSPRTERRQLPQRGGSLRERVHGLTVALIFGRPVRPQFTIAKQWLHFRVAIGPVAFSVFPLDFENVLGDWVTRLDASAFGDSPLTEDDARDDAANAEFARAFDWVVARAWYVDGGLRSIRLRADERLRAAGVPEFIHRQWLDETNDYETPRAFILRAYREGRAALAAAGAPDGSVPSSDERTSASVQVA